MAEGMSILGSRDSLSLCLFIILILCLCGNRF